MSEEHLRDFGVLERSGERDDRTRRVVLARLDGDRQLRFFSEPEAATARALIDRLIGLDDEPDLPVLQLVDERLAAGETDGRRHEGMPEDSEAWRRTLAWLDADADVRESGHTFAALDRDVQIDVLEDVHAAAEWHGLPAAQIWSLWTRYACAAFFSHPRAWNEIGFGGPASPTGYQNLGVNGREAWEVSEPDATAAEPWAERVKRARRRRVHRRHES
jgi:hypothetical protein